MTGLSHSDGRANHRQYGVPNQLLISVTADMLYGEAPLASLVMGLSVPPQLRIVAHANAGLPTRHLLSVGLLEVDPPAVALTLGAMLLRLMDGQSVPSRCC
jgi:hypothetical protein